MATKAKEATPGADELAGKLEAVKARGRELYEDIQAAADELEEARRAVAAGVADGKPEAELEERRKEARRLEERHHELNAGLRECVRREEALRARHARAAFLEYGPKAADALQELARDARSWLAEFRERWQSFEDLERRAGPGPRGATDPVDAAREEIGVRGMAVLASVAHLAEELDTAPEDPEATPHGEPDFNRRTGSPGPRPGAGAEAG